MRFCQWRAPLRGVSAESPTAGSEAKKPSIVAFDSLAWRYDDLFLISRIGTQRGAAWALLADIFQPGYAILAVNCRRQDALFLALLDVSVVGRDKPCPDTEHQSGGYRKRAHFRRFGSIDIFENQFSRRL